MDTFQHFSTPHRRWNPLLESWVLVSPQRGKRPWQGAVEKRTGADLPEYDEACYLCPRNARAGGAVNPDYKGTYVFTNDFPAVLPSESNIAEEKGLHALHQPLSALHGLIQSEEVTGTCRVICYSEHHNATMTELEKEDILKVIHVWGEQYETLKRSGNIKYILIFENKGSLMGCSNPHPHGQIWATSSIPGTPLKIYESQRKHFEAYGTRLLHEYIHWELDAKERIITDNDDWAAVVPYWAVWPFELQLIPKRAKARSITELTASERENWADILKRVLVAYDTLFSTSFPYSMGIYQEPVNTDEQYEGSVLFQQFHPPLLRSASVKKFMVGFEMFGEAQRDLTPEDAADRLRNCLP